MNYNHNYLLNMKFSFSAFLRINLIGWKAAAALLFLAFFSACQDKPTEKPKTWTLEMGKWRGEVEIVEGKRVPFLFEVEKDSAGNFVWTLLNGQERFRLDEVIQKDSLFTIPLYIFDAEIEATLSSTNTLQGVWRRRSFGKATDLPFSAEKTEMPRFEAKEPPISDFSGSWETYFLKANGDSVPALATFSQEGAILTGTFQTKTGDYRFLEGIVEGNTLKLSGFDGATATRFEATLDTSTQKRRLKGDFWAGASTHQTWQATFNPTFELPDAESLTKLKEGFDKIQFRFPNIEGKEVALTDTRFQNKVVIVQILGTWCHNCMDEVAFLAPFYEKNKAQGLEIIGLAYEQTDNFEQAQKRLQRLENKMKVTYELLFAGTNERQFVEQSLPMLEGTIAFPTTIFIDKKGKVRKIHTGFSGPSTGASYQAHIDKISTFVAQLLKEE
ncbi:TlpA disulfide reductase family protein [Hugenholtzia roseola]|uniref:TlpA disulfide reductase family protein n=1 Tax=Hugenholtzia roseola TaxID=1002 RepID=UPI000688A4C1|nr:TlpA disulfide reductase family protein [Hugenholtzia roseola]